MVLSPFVSHCTPSCFPLLDGVSTFSGVLSPTGWCSRLPKGLVSLCLPLYPFLFAPCWMVCLPSRERVLSPTVPLLVSLCWMVSPPSAGSCLPLSPIVPLLVLQTVCCSGFSSCSLCSMVCPLPEGLVSLCLPLYPFLFPFVGWCVRLPGGLVSPCLPSCFLLLDGVSAVSNACLCSCLPSCFLLLNCWMVCPPSRGLVSPCLPLSSFCVRIPEVLSPLVSLLVSYCWMVRPPSWSLTSPSLPLSPHMCACVGWCVRLPEGLGSHCLPLNHFLLFPFVGWCVLLPQGLVAVCLPLYPFLFYKQCTVRGSFLVWVVSFCLFPKQCTVRGS